jgi:S-adenosylmethionine:tRNA ribosyltransferase-isomerase
MDRRDGNLVDSFFYRLPDWLRQGDLLVLNDTRVIPARLRGKRATGGKVEVLLERPLAEGADAKKFEGRTAWRCMARPAARLKPGEDVEFHGGFFGKWEGRSGSETGAISFDADICISELLKNAGEVPLPPYIDHSREDEQKRQLDRQRYQTVFARHDGAVAAPTAGLHFTFEVIEALAGKNIEVVYLTLHVGLGTFLPIRKKNVREHIMLPERFSISAATAASINKAKNEGRRVVAVGTTSVRALESAPQEKGLLKSAVNETDLYIYPGFQFKVVDAMVTNFHLPQTTLILMVSAFAGWDRIKKAYEHAMGEKYRFYSYGDAMLII